MERGKSDHFISAPNPAISDIGTNLKVFSYTGSKYLTADIALSIVIVSNFQQDCQVLDCNDYSDILLASGKVPGILKDKAHIFLLNEY